MERTLQWDQVCKFGVCHELRDTEVLGRGVTPKPALPGGLLEIPFLGRPQVGSGAVRMELSPF